MPHEPLFTDVDASIRYVPEAMGPVGLATITTPEGTKSMFVSGNSTEVSGTGEDLAVRSGFVQVQGSEPANTMCPIMRAVAPLTGKVALSGTCLGDGLVSVML